MLTGGCAGAPDTKERIALEPYAGPVFVEIETFAGNVTVHANPKYDAGSVTVHRQALHGKQRKEEAIASLPEIEVETLFGEDLIGRLLSVNATTTHAEPYNQRANLRIDLPRIDGLRVRTPEGNVIVHGVQGEVDIESHDGEIRLITRQPMLEAVSIVAHDGDIIFRMRPESSGRFDAEAPRGEVMHKFKMGRLLISDVSHNRLQASFNDGANQVLLRALDGDVKIAVVEDPEKIGRWVVN